MPDLKSTIPYGKQSISEEDIAAVTAVLRSDWLTTGPAVERFENALCQLTGAKYAFACSNGTTALHLACLALGVKPGDRGVTSPLTFLASANCLEYCGARADFCDIDQESLCLSPARVKEYCDKNGAPKVVIPVDFAGVPAHLPHIHALAKQYGFAVIEDAAHSIGSTYDCDGATYQCGCCAHTDLATFSFHPVKTITCAEGGAVLTNRSDLAERVRLLRSHGMTKDPALLTRTDGPWYYEMHEPGFNYRITDLQCALGLSQLQRINEFKQRRQEIVARYNKAFENNSDYLLPPWPQGTSPCFHLYVLRSIHGYAARKALSEQLLKHKIGTQVHYYPVHLQPYYTNKYGYTKGQFPRAEEYYEQCLSLPLYPSMSDTDVEQVIAAVKVR